MTKMSLELEAEAVRLSEDGHTSREVVRLLGCSKSEVGNVLVRQAIRLLPHGPSQQNRESDRLRTAPIRSKVVVSGVALRRLCGQWRGATADGGDRQNLVGSRPPP